MYKLGRPVGNTISRVFYVSITSTKLKAFKFVLTYTKNVREPFRNVHACMNTLSISSLFRPVAGVINMPWIHGIKLDMNSKKSPTI